MRKISSGRCMTPWIVVQFQDRLKSAKLSKRKAEFELEMAKSKLDAAREYEKPKRLKELKADSKKPDATNWARSSSSAREEPARHVGERTGSMHTALEIPTHPVASHRGGTSRQELRDRLAKLEPRTMSRRRECQAIDELGKVLEAKLNEAGRLFEDLKFSELAGDLTSLRLVKAPAQVMFSPAVHPCCQVPEYLAEDRARLKTATQKKGCRSSRRPASPTRRPGNEADAGAASEP